MLKTLVAAVLLTSAAAAALAQSTPVGLWRTIDDETKQEKSLVRITENAGVLTGRVEKLADPAKQAAVCDQCSDDRKDKPIVGMTIVRGVKQDADDKTVWTGGQILDPQKGKTYRLRLKPADNGKTMEVRGYVGPFFRNQQWIRVE